MLFTFATFVLHVFYDIEHEYEYESSSESEFESCFVVALACVSRIVGVFVTVGMHAWRCTWRSVRDSAYICNLSYTDWLFSALASRHFHPALESQQLCCFRWHACQYTYMLKIAQGSLSLCLSLSLSLSGDDAIAFLSGS